MLVRHMQKFSLEFELVAMNIVVTFFLYSHQNFILYSQTYVPRCCNEKLKALTLHTAIVAEQVSAFHAIYLFKFNMSVKHLCDNKIY